MWVVLLFGIVVIIFVAAMVDGIDNSIQIGNNSELSCDLEKEHWTLVEWFFDRITTYIEVTEISNYQWLNSRFSNYLVHQLMLTSSLKVKIFSAEYEPKRAIAHTAHIENNTLQPAVRQIIKNKLRPRRLSFRRDEPELGAILYTTTAEILHDYVVGQHPPRTFENPAGNFVIIITKSITDEHIQSSREMAAQVMEHLWRSHRMLNAFLIFSCNNRRIGYYDPFYFDPTDNLEYGAMIWLLVTELDDARSYLLNKGQNHRGHPFRSSMFPRYPTLIPAHELADTYRYSYFANAANYAAGHAGFDGLVLGNLAKVHNFQVEEVQTMNYGLQMENNTFTGAIGDVLYERAEIAINSRFIMDYGTEDIEFIHPVFSDMFCIIAPSALAIPAWKAIFKCFQILVWILIAVVGLLCACFWYFLKKTSLLWQFTANDLSAVKRTPSLMDVTFNMFHIMVASTTAMPVQTKERLFITACLISSIVTIGAFQGSVTTSFSTPTFEPEINTLRQLDESGLMIHASATTIGLLFGDTNTVNPLLLSLMKKLCTKSKSDTSSPIETAAYKRDKCGVERYSDFYIIRKTVFERSDGSNYLHIVKECPRYFHLGYILKKGSPYRARFNRVLLVFFESGLLQKWYDYIEYALIASRKMQQEDTIKIALNIKDLQAGFFVLGIGLLISIIVFAIEITYMRYIYFV